MIFQLNVERQTARCRSTLAHLLRIAPRISRALGRPQPSHGCGRSVGLEITVPSTCRDAGNNSSIPPNRRRVQFVTFSHESSPVVYLIVAARQTGADIIVIRSILEFSVCLYYNLIYQRDGNLFIIVVYYVRHTVVAVVLRNRLEVEVFRVDSRQWAVKMTATTEVEMAEPEDARNGRYTLVCSFSLCWWWHEAETHVAFRKRKRSSRRNAFYVRCFLETCKCTTYKPAKLLSYLLKFTREREVCMF